MQGVKNLRVVDARQPPHPDVWSHPDRCVVYGVAETAAQKIIAAAGA